MKRAAAMLFLLFLAPSGAHAQTPGKPSELDETQLTGMRLFNQSCRVCHARPQAASPQYGPVLSKDSLGGQDGALVAFIARGSPRMPGFGSHFRPKEIAAIVAYLKTLAAPAARWPESD
jgi:mono/diheme cytochrome c family protein